MSVSTPYRMPGGGARSWLHEIAPGTGPRTPSRIWLVRSLALAAAGAFAFLAVEHGGEFAHAVGRALHAHWHLVVLAVVLEAGSAIDSQMLYPRSYTYRRLQAIKAKYDQVDIIQSNHPIPPSR